MCMIKYRLSDISYLLYIQCENKRLKHVIIFLFDHLEIQLIPLQYIDSKYSSRSICLHFH